MSSFKAKLSRLPSMGGGMSRGGAPGEARGDKETAEEAAGPLRVVTREPEGAAAGAARRWAGIDEAPIEEGTGVPAGGAAGGAVEAAAMTLVTPVGAEEAAARVTSVAPVTPVAPVMPVAPVAPERPSLDELRERIARIVGRGMPATPRADPTREELPFFLEQTEEGPLYTNRVRSLPAARVGRAPLVAARDAEGAMLALLALDPALAGCDVRRALYLDTETTGLAGGTGTVPFLIGLAWFDEEVSGEGGSGFVVEQFLLRRLGEEGPMLRRLRERLEKASMIVTYNGKAFDMPLLRTRFVMNRLPPPPEVPHLDLVHMARRIHKGRLKTRTLIALEHEVLGRVRVGDTPGGEIVQAYAHFLRSGDEGALLGVVEHNAADVLAMVALVGLYGEPLGSLIGEDLAGVAATLRRAGALERAAELAEAAVAQGGGAAALRARGDIARARGDRARALKDYEALAAEVDDAGVRLALAKLYEHHVRSFAKALEMVEQGTAETDPAQERRKARLQKKMERAAGAVATRAASVAGAEGGGSRRGGRRRQVP
ncbi:ribonuclease H-like domain-containing protein [Chondromyces apiculatus]|uniref:YprB ribonuclease H-like domain-containing protein n=1 Tax=Chondromyces apiculatus DSM 436 TaxID=1192034 RepID=A0A017SZQ9_9BACT|nr:ribonuclease H-like domain-containing protein [Chondromyces apiculatus]EYF02458.1 Hypothetical protein CAP_7080 [Chondromyces apiculatus DSM 436]